MEHGSKQECCFMACLIGTFETCAFRAFSAAAAAEGLPWRTVIGAGGGGPPVSRSVTVAASVASAASASTRLPAHTKHEATRVHVPLARGQKPVTAPGWVDSFRKCIPQAASSYRCAAREHTSAVTALPLGTDHAPAPAAW